MTIRFNASPSIVRCGTAGGVGAGSAWSAAAWAYIIDTATARNIVAKRSGFSVGTNQFDFSVQATTFALQISFNATPVVTNSNMTANIWQHVGVATDASGVIGYINGVGSAQVNGVFTSGTNTNQNLDIGGLSYASAQYWKGFLGEVAVWNIKLAATDFVKMSQGILPRFISPLNLVHYWPLIGENMTEPDLSGNPLSNGTSFNTWQGWSLPDANDGYIFNLPALFPPVAAQVFTFSRSGAHFTRLVQPVAY